MKTWLISVLLVLLSVSTSPAKAGDSGVSAEFREANALYAQGEYEQAAALYKDILGRGWESSALYFNLGNSYFKDGNLGRAILNYRRAWNLAPRDPEVNKNLEYARENLRDDISALPLSLTARVRRAIVRQFSFGIWLGISSTLYFLTTLWIPLILLIRPLKKVSPPVLKILLPLLLLSILITVSAYLYYRAPRAIVLEPSVSVRYGPKEDDAVAFELHEGTEVGVVRKKDVWCQIILPDGKSGWLPSSSSEII